MISVLVSARCQFACPYCYVPRFHVQADHEVVDAEFAAIAMKDFFMSNSSRTIRYFGAGEPTTAFDLMVELRDRAYQLAGSKLNVELQTNGYFWGEVAEWVERNINILWVSCDGPPEIQDRQRPVSGGNRSSDVVIKNVERFARCARMQFGIRATIATPNFSRQVELVEYFHGLGVRYICVAPEYSSSANPSVPSPPLVEFAVHFVPAFYHAQRLGVFYQTHLMVNFDEEVDHYCRACTPCPHVTTDGYVSCCDWALFGPDYLPGPLQQLVYGRFDKNSHTIIYDEAKIARIRSRNLATLQKHGCNGCSVLSHCAGGCLGKVIVETGDLYRAHAQWCAAVRYMANKLPLNEGLFPCFHS